MMAARTASLREHLAVARGRRAAPAGRVPQRRGSPARRAARPPPRGRADPRPRVRCLGRRNRMGLQEGHRSPRSSGSPPCPSRPRPSGCAPSACVSPSASARWRSSGSGASAPSWPSTGRRCCGRSCSPYLVAAVVLRLALVLGRFLLAPDGGGDRRIAERFRVVPLSADAARFWYRRLALFVGWFAFGRATLDVLSALGFSPEARELVAYTLGLGLLAIALNVVWTQPRASDPPSRTRRGTRPATGLLPGFCPFAWCCSGGSGSSGSCACSGSWRSRSSCPRRSRSPGWRAITSPVRPQDPGRRPRQG